MRLTTADVIRSVRKIYTEMAFSEDFEKRMPDAMRKELDDFHIKHMAKELVDLGPIKAGYIENMLAEPMSKDLVTLIILLCISTRGKIDDTIAKTVLKDMALNAVAQSEPKGDA